jgi:hypothetical protein
VAVADDASPPPDVLTVDVIIDMFQLAAARRWGALEVKYPQFPFVPSLRELDDFHLQALFRQLLEQSGVHEGAVERELRAAFGGARLN